MKILSYGALLLVMLLEACAQQPAQQEPTPEEPPPTAQEKPRMESQPLKHLVGRKLEPQPTRPLNVRSKCTHRDAVGTRTRLSLNVKNGVVKTFDAKVDIPKRGLCEFNLKHFKQVAKLPNALLEASDGGGCSVRMWEQGPRTTVAFNNCATFCEGEAFDYLWPIVVVSKTGRCF